MQLRLESAGAHLAEPAQPVCAVGALAALVHPVHEEEPRVAQTAPPREGAGGKGRADARSVSLHCALT